MEKAMSVKPLFARAVAMTLFVAGPMAHAAPTKDECIDANESAQSSRSSGKLREAVALLTLCLARSCPRPVREDCAERLREVQSALPSIVFVVRTEAGVELTDVHVTMDGVLLTAKIDGTAVAVDPGPHTFTFRAEGFVDTEEAILVREGDKALRMTMTVRSSKLRSSPPSSANVEAPAATAPQAVVRSERDPDGAPPRSIRTRVLPLAMLGVGAAGVAVGSVFGAMAMMNKSSLRRHCDGDACPSSERDDIDGLRSNGMISTTAFGVGIAGLATGVVLLLLTKDNDGERPAATRATTAQLTWGPRFIGIAGAFQ